MLLGLHICAEEYDLFSHERTKIRWTFCRHKREPPCANVARVYFVNIGLFDDLIKKNTNKPFIGLSWVIGGEKKVELIRV